MAICVTLAIEGTLLYHAALLKAKSDASFVVSLAVRSLAYCCMCCEYFQPSSADARCTSQYRF